MALFFIFFCTFPLFFTVVCHRYVTNRKRIPPYSFANYDGILFRLSEKQSLFSFCRSENISQFIIFSLLLLFLLLLLSLQDCRFSFSLSRYGNGISFLFSVLFCRCMCISFLFSALRSSDSCHFSLWNDIPDNRLHPSLSSSSELRFCPFWLFAVTFVVAFGSVIFFALPSLPVDCL